MADSDVMAMPGIKFDKNFLKFKIGDLIVYHFLSCFGPNIYYIAKSFSLIFQKLYEVSKNVFYISSLDFNVELIKNKKKIQSWSGFEPTAM